MRRFVTLLAGAVALATVTGCGTDRGTDLAGTDGTATPAEAVTWVPLPDGLHTELAGQAQAHPLPGDVPLDGQDFAATVRDTPAGVGFALRSLPPCTESVPMSLDDESVEVAHNVTYHDDRYLVARQISVFRDEYAEQFAEAFAQPARCSAPGLGAPVGIGYTGFGKSEEFPYRVLAEKHRAWASGEVFDKDGDAVTWVDLVVRRGSTVALVRVVDLAPRQTVVTARNHDRTVAAKKLRARAADEMAWLLELLSERK